jgi:L-cysteine S-thiosulfotransferase
MRHRTVVMRAALALSAVILALSAVMLSVPVLLAQTSETERAIERYREMVKKDPFANPALLWVDYGETLWSAKRGPKAVALAAVCDLGRGVGKTEAAYATLPKFFADAGRVMDLEARIFWCMTTLQGFDAKALNARKFSPNGAAGDTISDIEAMATFAASKSSGQTLKVDLSSPQMRDSYALGEALFFRRMGPWDFSCASCHDESGRRIRLQGLPNLSKSGPDAQITMGTWPAFRASQESVRTMQHRLYDCFWQMRLPAVDYGSDVTVALTTYLNTKAEGGIIDVPSIKR